MNTENSRRNPFKRSPRNRMPGDKILPTRSVWLCRWFTWYTRKHMRRHFHAVRVARRGRPPQPMPDGPLLFVTNHPSWWDPLFGLLLADRFTSRQLFAPIDAESLRRFPFMRRLGLFGIDLQSLRGARTFLETALTVLHHAEAVLAVTAQGELTDVRVRPVVLRPGVGHLCARLSQGTVIPLAFEYCFWNSRLPEALVSFGEPISIVAGVSADAWTQRLATALSETQDQLAQDSQQRNPALFDTLLGGGTGTGGVYDWWRRLRGWFTGRPVTDELP